MYGTDRPLGFTLYTTMGAKHDFGQTTDTRNSITWENDGVANIIGVTIDTRDAPGFLQFEMSKGKADAQKSVA